MNKPNPSSFRQKVFTLFESGLAPTEVTRQLNLVTDSKEYKAVFIYYNQWNHETEKVAV